jgi:hypothetical protein
LSTAPQPKASCLSLVVVPAPQPKASPGVCYHGAGPEDLGSWVHQVGFLGPHLFLGNWQVARDREWLHRHGVGWLLRCVPAWEVPQAGPPPLELAEYELLLTRPYEGEGRMLRQLQHLQRVVEQELLRPRRSSAPHNLLVWCKDGKLEGAAAIACILAQLERGLSADEVMAGIACLRTGASCQAQLRSC